MSNPSRLASAPWRNRMGILVVAAALATLVTANMLPFLHVQELGDQRSYTILGGIIELFHHDDSLLGTAIFVFSFLFPFAKLLMLVPATGFPTQLSNDVRARLLRTALWLGKYSMLDVFVGAVLIVVTRMQGLPMLQGLIKVETGSGLLLFLLAWLLSAAAGNMMIVPGGNPCMTNTSSTESVTAKRQRFGLKAAIVGLLLLLSGVGAVLLSPSVDDVATIRAVRLIEKPAININVLPQRQHDLYLELQTAHGTIRTATQRRAVIGNGLTIVLPEPVRFRDIRSVAAWDARESTLWDRMHRPQQLDRIDELQFLTTGSLFHFKMESTSQVSLARWIPLLIGDALVGAGIIALAWWALARRCGEGRTDQ